MDEGEQGAGIHCGMKSGDYRSGSYLSPLFLFQQVEAFAQQGGDAHSGFLGFYLEQLHFLRGNPAGYDKFFGVRAESGHGRNPFLLMMQTVYCKEIATLPVVA